MDTCSHQILDSSAPTSEPVPKEDCNTVLKHVPVVAAGEPDETTIAKEVIRAPVRDHKVVSLA